MSPVAIAAVLVVVVGVLAFFGYKAFVASGPQVQSVEDMPPEVRKAYAGHGTK